MARKAVVYVAGPMRGIDRFNFPAFDEAAICLRSVGWEVLNPADHDREGGFDETLNCLDGFDLEAAMRWDIGSILQANAVALLPGWRKSSGVAIEVTVADAVGCPLFEFDRGVDGCLRSVEPESVAQEAHRLVHGSRQADYGHPADDFARTGRMWGAILGIPDVAPERVGLCMAAVKISREVNAHKRDNLADMAGYATTVDLVHTRSPKE